MHVHHAAVLADLEDEGGGGERVVPRVEGPGAKSATCVSNSWAIVETCDFDSRVMPNHSTSFSILRVDTPSR